MRRDNPRDLWSDAVDVAEWTPSDFESRTRSLSIWDAEQQYRRLAAEFGDAWNVERNVATDRTIRLYVAHILDSEDTLDLRAEFDVRVLVPPEGWVEENREAWAIPTDLPEPELVEEESKRQWKPTSAETVGAMVSTLVDEYDFHESISEFNRAALRFVARIENDG